jgi:diguanylate cyclase (GGDEF)-like protein/hemerythrin-like metal-binding protein/PAS domain S-box-containing protein
MMCAPDRPDPEEDFPMRVVAPASPSSVPDQGARVDFGAFDYRVVEKCASGLAVLGLGGEILDANPAFCELTGHARETLRAPSFGLDQLFLLEDVADYHRHLSALSRGEEESYRQSHRFARPTGVVIWVDLTVHLLRDDRGNPDSLVVTAVDITEQRRAETAFREMSMRDPLTKLPNRRLLRDRLQSALARAERDESKVALLFLDLDGFKPINDTLGHEMGDWLLRAVAGRLGSCLRGYDTAARLGGDEFVVLLPALSQREDIHRVAERIRTSLATPFITEDGKRLEISVSIGVSLYPEHAESANDLLHAGDEAMYAAKKSGRNRIAFSERVPGVSAVPEVINDVHSGLIHLTWEPGFASGNAFIDTEHRELFRLSNQLLDLATRTDARGHAIGSAMARLVRSVEAHFQHEERILDQAAYPELAEHAAKHRQLAERAREVSKRMVEQPIAVGDILDFVVAKVIYGHVVTEDRDYFPLLKDRPAK